MDSSLSSLLALGMLSGIIGTFVGGYECAKGHAYSVAAQHEATTVGHIVGVSHGKGGPAWRYEFSANGAKVDDYSEVCATPLAQGACFNGPVLVYYSYQPYANSRLEDFNIASAHAYKSGKSALAVCLPLTVLTCAAMAILRKKRREVDSDVEDEERRSEHSDEPDEIHIVPSE